MTRLSVVGAAGGLGAALTRWARQSDHDLVAVVRPGEPIDLLGDDAAEIEVRRADVRRPDQLRTALSDAEVVVNAAGVVPRHPDRAAMRAVNVDGAHHVARVAADVGVRRLLHISSVSAIGFPPPDVVADETFDRRASVVDTAYGHSKWEGERTVLAVGSAHDLEVVVVNPGAVIAPSASVAAGWGALVDLVARRRMPVSVPGAFAWCGLDDFVQGVSAAIDRGRAGSRYVLATCNATYHEVMAQIAEELGVEPPRWTAPATPIRALARVLPTGRAVPRQVADLDLLTRTCTYSWDRARDELGFEPTDLRHSIRQTARWLADRGTDAHAIA